MNKHDRMYEKIEQHGINLNTIFNTGIEPVKLCKKLFRLENKLHALAEDYCNAKINENEFEIESKKGLKAVNKILKFSGIGKDVPVFFNHDPRGCALKINDEYINDNNIKIERDFGGYGLIAPDFRD